MIFLNLFHLHYFVRIIDMFRRFDVNKDGTLSHQEFRDGIIAAGSARISITNSSVRAPYGPPDLFNFTGGDFFIYEGGPYL